MQETRGLDTRSLRRAEEDSVEGDSTSPLLSEVACLCAEIPRLAERRSGKEASWASLEECCEGRAVLSKGRLDLRRCA